MKGPLSRVALEYNNLVARTTDEMMLTNILRARAREPMHFTSLSALHGNVSLTAEADLTAALLTRVVERDHGPDGVLSGDKITKPSSTFTPVRKGTVATNPSFDLAVDDSQQFYQGFLAPIEPQTVAHFLDDGWSPSLVTYLLVRRFDFVAENTILNDGGTATEAEDAGTDDAKKLLTKRAGKRGIFLHKGDIVGSLTNDADPAGDDFAAFKDFVSCHVLHATKVTKDDTVLIPIGAVSTLEGLDKLDGKPFDVEVVEGSTQLVRRGGDTDGLELRESKEKDALRNREGRRCPAIKSTIPEPAPVPGATFAYDKLSLRIDKQPAELTVQESEKSGRRRFQAEGDFVIAGPDQKPRRIAVGVAASLRSTALIYFLGEYARYDQAKKFELLPGAQGEKNACDPETPYPLIVLESRPVKSVLSATLHDKTWRVPDNSAECSGKTTEIIALVEQLYNLKKSSTDKVGTQSVRLIQ